MISFDVDGAEVQYVPTTEDVLTLHRAVEGEGADEAEVAQVLVNRFAYLLGTARRADGRPFYPTLAALVRAYSQPINPRWRKGGDKFEEAWASASERRRGVLKALNERRQAHARRTQFAPATVDAVKRALTLGPLNIEPGWLHFSAPGTGRQGLPALTPPVPGRNQMFGDPGATGWQGYQAGSATALATSKPAPELMKYAPAVLLAAALYMLTREK